MKKFLATLLALVMVLSMSATAFATDTVSYFVRGGSAEYEPYLYEILYGLQAIQKRADVKIDWTVVCGNGDEIKAQYLAKMSSGNYPDILQWQHNNDYVGGVNQMYNDGIIIPLNDLIDQGYMPNLKKILEENPSIANEMMNDDGQYLYVTAINPMTTDADRAGITWWGLMLRQDWLDNVGLEVPTTIDEWYEVLVAFRDGDPNGNGEQDEIPFDAASAGLNLFQPAFGFMDGIFIDPTTGKVNYGQYSQQYKAYLETMSKWYAEGLIKNVFDADGNPIPSADGDQNIYADLSGSFKALSNYWEQRLPQLLTKNPNADFIEASWPVYVNDSSIKYGDYTGISHVDRYTACISTSCEHPEVAARLLDEMLSDEGTINTTWGIEDGTNEFRDDKRGCYSVDENGNKYINDWGKEVEPFYDGNFARQYMFAMSHVCFPRFGGGDFTMATREENYVRSSYLWADCNDSLAFPSAVTLSQDAQKEAAAGLDDMGAYIKEMTVKFITGEEPLTNFDNYIDTLQKMGMDDLIAAYQAAYDRYLSRGK